MARSRKRKTKQDDNVWTSNSDLFMALAVVFLILFVFTMLKSGVSQVKTAKEKQDVIDYLKGQIPEKVVKKSNAQIKNMEKSMKLIESKKKKLDSSVTTINELVTQIESERKNMKDIVKTYRMNEAALKESNKQIKEQIVQIKQNKLTLKETKKLMQVQQKERQKEVKEMAKEVASQAKKIVQMNQKNKTVKLQNSDLVAKLSESQKMSKNIDAKVKEYENKVVKTKQMNTRILKSVKMAKEKIEKKNEEIAVFQKKIETLTSSEKSLQINQSKMTTENQTMQGQLDQSKKNLQQTQSKNSSAQKSLQDQIKAMSGKIQGLENSLGKANKQSKKLAGQLSGAQEQAQQKGASDGEKISNLKGKIANLNGSLGQLKGGLHNKKGEIKGLKSSLGKMEGRLAGEQMQGKQRAASDAVRIEKLEKKIARLKSRHKNLKATGVKKQRKIASLSKELNKAVGTVQGYFTERKKVVTDIQEALRSQGIEVDVNPETGILTLNMDDVFKFKNNSYVMSPEAKDKLNKIIPIYAEKLFGRGDSVKQVEMVTITGNASPQFRRKYVDPAADDPEAYEYNLKLSMARAQQIAQYLFSSEMQDFPYKQELKRKTRVAARSYLHPVLADQRTRASQLCGSYDCSRSRRVEIQFIFSNDNDLKEKFSSKERDYHVSR